MSSAKSQLAPQPRRQFVSTQAYNNDIFTYTTSQTTTSRLITGVLAANVVNATAANCPAGRILRENGQKLYPGVNNGVNTYMVGVFDTQTMLSGYIDPNSPIYAVYSTELPEFYANGVDPGPQGLTDEGPPVYTNGLVYALESITAGTSINATTGYVSVGSDMSAGTVVTTNSGVVCVSGQILVNNVTTIKTISHNISINPALSQVFYIDFSGGAAVDASFNIQLPAGTTMANFRGSTLYLLLNNESTTSSITVQFNNLSGGFRSNGPFVLTKGGSGPTYQRATIAFFCDGAAFFEINQAYNNGA